MKRYFYIYLVILTSNCTMAQIITPDSLIGEWTVTKILKKPSNLNFADLATSFTSATFIFGINKSFKLTTNNNNRLFSMITDATKNSKWRINKNGLAINVGSDADHYSILKIIVLNANDKIIFRLAETDFDLEMTKVD